MKHLFTLFAALFFFSSAEAQTTPVLSGKVMTADSKAIQGATVQLLKENGKTLVKVSVSDAAGAYSFENIPAANYIISVSTAGFEKKVTNVQVKDVSVVTVRDLTLSEAIKGLGGVTVTATKPFIEQKLDRTIVNVDASPSNAGATALEVLEKSPGVTVDNDGNISLKGKQGVIVMMDGKPTYLSAADLANVLRNLPASALEQIEIMTNPSSKYDAAGNSGVINIKTKKSKARGSNGSIAIGNTAGLFRYKGEEEILWKPNLSVNYNYKKNKVNVFSNFAYNYREGRGLLGIVSRYYRDSKQIDSINNVNTLFKARNNNYTLKVGMDYSPDKKNTFGVVLNGFMFAGRPSSTTFTTFTDLEGNAFSRLNSAASNKVSWNNFSTNLNYKHTFDSTGRELTIDADYALYDNVTRQVLNTGFYDGNYNQTADSLFLRGRLPSKISIYSLKSDYVHPFSNGLRIEGGLKISYVQSDNLVNYERKSPAGWIPDARNNNFIYDENINAAYVNASRQLKKWNLQAGLRMENTNTKGTQVIDNSVVKRNYVSFFPTAFASYNVNTDNSLTLSFSRRLQRPNYQDLNPFTFFLDSLSYRQGNPFLTPQFSYNYELIHGFKGKIITTVNYSKTTDVISNIINRNRGANNEIIGFLTSDNIASYTNMGIAISAPIKFAKWWNTNLYGNVYRNHFEGTYISNETGSPEVVPLDIAFTSFTININNSFNIAKGWTAELSGWYRYKTVEQLSLAYPMGQLNIGIGKNNLLKGRGSLRLNARDPFNWQMFRGLTKYGTVDIDITNRWDNRQYGATFTYRFGKQQGQQKRKSSSTEEEQKRIGVGQG